MSTTSSKDWFVLFTKPRSEKKLAELLIRDGIEAYCPVQIQYKQWSDRKKKVETPLLPSMILVRLEETERDRVFNRKQALRYLYWLGRPATVSTKEVEGLISMAEDTTFEKHGLEKLKPGETLDMTKLGFEQVEGTVKFVNQRECWIILKHLGYLVKFKRTKA
ncbi:UpxY family transcription antiterminator [Psychroflexus tropicus]|uniref:UpxY family transcription antiterminator n=1 Tax=Psychroflexus tropicus TaxID=197345 RepID=UPI00036EC359|nr:UpxY family transcription antiterminator [Psychroflexus tropicus]